MIPKPTKAMIYAAGFGKRLLPLTKSIPKPLIPVQNIVVLDWIFVQLQKYDIKEIAINTHYLSEKIKDHLSLGTYSQKVKLFFEPEILGTGGGLQNTRSFWGTDNFYLCNADILCTADLNRLFEFHNQQQPLATLAVNNCKSSSMLLVDQYGKLVGMQKNTERSIYASPDGPVKAVGFCGMHVINPEVFDWLDTPASFSIIDEYLKIIEKGGRIVTWDIGNAFWTDVGSIQGLENANRHFPGF